MRSDWQAVIEAERPSRTVTFGETTFTLVAPSSLGAINAVYLPKSKLKALAEALGQQVGKDLTPEVVAACRMIRACLEDPPDIAVLCQVAVKQPGFFNQLSTTAMDLCGLLSVDSAVEAAQGEEPAGQS